MGGISGIPGRDSANGIDLTWQGDDEMDEASGRGSLQLDDDGTPRGWIRFHLGDESGFKARHEGGAKALGV